MKGLLTIIKIFAVLGVILGLVGLAIWLQSIRREFAEVSNLGESLEDVIEKNEEIGFEPGQFEFNRALELIAIGKLDDARGKFESIQNLYPDSRNAPEARRILGEINLDEILSVENMENKKLHQVVSGDGYLRIATKNETTLDCIMFLNGLTELGPLHVGDELIVMPLDLKLVVDLKNERVELFHRDREKKEHVFAKDYPIIGTNLVRSPTAGKHTKISRKAGEIEGRSYPPTHSKYRHATKILGFSDGRARLELRPEPLEGQESTANAIYLSGPDMEELAMLIRINNEVEIKPGS